MIQGFAFPDPGRGDRTKLDSFTLRPYRLPLSRPWRSARGLFRERRGWLVRAGSDGVWGFGDCAPLPEAGTEPWIIAKQALEGWWDRLPGMDIDSALHLLRTSDSAAPAASYAVECALLDLQSRLVGMPLRRWILGPGSATARDWVQVNAMLGPSQQVSNEALDAAIAAGYRVLKIKVGCSDPKAEVRHLTALSQSLPAGVGLRLDANGAWDLETAVRVIDALTELPIESLEEPLGRPDLAALVRLQACAPFPLALDESLRDWIRGADATPFPVRRAVVKPAVIGGVAATLHLVERLHDLGVEGVLTGIVDSAAGLWPTAQLSAAIGSHLAQGLATWDWLTADLGVPPIPSAGRIRLPDSPGSGFEPFTSGHARD